RIADQHPSYPVNEAFKSVLKARIENSALVVTREPIIGRYVKRRNSILLDVDANVAEVRHQAGVRGLRILIILSWAQCAPGGERTVVDTNGNLPSSFNRKRFELASGSEGHSGHNSKTTIP